MKFLISSCTFALLIVLNLWFVQTASAANTAVSGDVQKVKTENTTLTALSWAPRVGWVWNIMSQIFDTTGRIQTQFLEPFQNVFNSNAGNILKWTGTTFTPSILSASSTIVSINGSANITWVINWANNFIGRHFYDASNTSYKFISWWDSYSRGGNILMYGWSNGTISNRNDIRFRTDALTRMAIDGATWNVWIGLASPTTKLDVNGDIKTRTRVLSNLYCNEAGTECFSIDNILKDCKLQYRWYNNKQSPSAWATVVLDGTSNAWSQASIIRGIRSVDDKECDWSLGCGIEMRIVCN